MHIRFITLLVVGVCLLAGGLARGESSPADSQPIGFNRDILPILSDNCFYCHGPDKNHREADLRLDVRDDAVDYGAIVPGEPDESALIARIFAEDPEDRMPPPQAHKTLTEAQTELFRRWIAEGAEYEPHWAYIPPARHQPPKVAAPRARIDSPIDAFIQARLVDRGLTPAPEADRRTLLRRLSLDLIGLPPTVDEVQAFLNDDDPQSYERAVDRLLDSPHYGERMAIGWLDVVRYADTVGFHGDQNQNAWAYRDYVIDSFNQNKPFDQFTIEQLAGDLLPNATDQQRLATCFNRLNMMTREGGAQPKEYLAKYAADRVRTVAMTWLGSTFGCAECHDHKFDPIATKDFYSLAAFFADVKQWGVYHDYGYTPNPDLRGWSNEHPFPPEITVPSRYLLSRIEQLRRQIAGVVQAASEPLGSDPQAQAAYDTWQQASLEFLKQHPSGWKTIAPVVTTADDNTSSNASPAAAQQVQTDGVIFAGKSPANDQIVLQPGPGWIAAIQLELLPMPQQKESILRNGTRGSANVKLSASLHGNGEKKSQTLAFRHASADLVEPQYANGFEVIGILGGWKTAAGQSDKVHTGVWLLDRPVAVADGDTLVISLPNNQIGSVRVSVSPLASNDISRLGSATELLSAFESADAAQNPVVQQAYLRSTAWNTAAYSAIKALDAEVLTCRDGQTPVMVTVAADPRVTRVLPRGNWQDESGEIVEPAIPHFLPQPTDAPQRLTRLDLARWLVSTENPLTSRVVMNRLWKQFFGAGLSTQVDDFGAQGEAPTHPELLDWLAVEFRDSGWDVKHMVKLVVMSATYRQDSNASSKARNIDPDNRLLSHQSPRRLEAELVRDNALAIAGILNHDLGGPPCKPYQPAGYYENLQFPDRQYVSETDERQYRRGVYTHWQRTFVHPMLTNFGAPSREDCIAARTLANTPQQALTLLNDPTFVEAARVLAADLLAADSESDQQRIELAYQRALSRSMRDDEFKSMQHFLEQLRAVYRASPDDAQKLLDVGLAGCPTGVDPAELAAWTSVCRVILNLHETITRY